MKHKYMTIDTVNRLLCAYIVGVALFLVDWKTAVLVTAMVAVAHILIIAETIIQNGR